MPSILGAKKAGTAGLILRHDIDISIEKAQEMAEIEKEIGVKSTYMVMINSPFYRIQDNNSKSILQRLIKIGHNIGLHYDIGYKQRKNACNINTINSEIYRSRKKLEAIVGAPILSLSFHRPLQQFLWGPLRVCKMVNAYSKELMGCYFSESKGSWRDKDFLSKLLRSSKNISIAQLLIHPIWWGDRHMPPYNRLQGFFKNETKGRSLRYTKLFDRALADAVPAVWGKP